MAMTMNAAETYRIEREAEERGALQATLRNMAGDIGTVKTDVGQVRRDMMRLSWIAIPLSLVALTIALISLIIVLILAYVLLPARTGLAPGQPTLAHPGARVAALGPPAPHFLAALSAGHLAPGDPSLVARRDPTET